MGKLLRFIIGVLGFIIIVPLILIGAFFVTFDFDAFKKDISQQASKAIGREIAVNGAIGVSFEHGLSLSVKDVRIGSPDNFKEKDFIKAGTVAVALNWQALSQHKIDIKQFIVQDATINLATNKAGENNWDIKLPSQKPLAKPIAAEVNTTANKNEIAPEFKIESFDLNSVQLINTVIRQIDERKNKTQELFVEKATVNAPYEGALNIGMRGKFNNVVYTLEFLAPQGWRVLADGTKPTPIDLKADYAGESYALKANYSHSAKMHDLKNMQARVKDMDMSGNLNIRLDSDVPFISGNLSIPEFSLPKAAQPTQKTAHATIHDLVMQEPVRANVIVSSAPAPDFSALKAANTDLNLNVDKLVLADGQILENAKARILLSAGRLRLDPFSATLLNVAYKGMLDFNPAGPVTRLQLNGKNIDFVALAKAFNSTSPLSANGDMDIDITGQGFTPEAFKKSLSGKIQMTAGKGAVDMGGSGAAGINLIRMLYPRTQATEKQNINCAAMRFNASNGVLHANGILFDSPLAAVAGEGSVDLANDNANLLFRHAVKDKQAGSLLNVPIRATGPLAAMNFAPEETAIVEKVAGVFSGGGSNSTGVPKVDMNAAGNPCIAALNNPQPIMVEQMKPQEAVKATINQAKDIIKEIKNSDDAVNKLKGLFGR